MHDLESCDLKWRTYRLKVVTSDLGSCDLQWRTYRLQVVTWIGLMWPTNVQEFDLVVTPDIESCDLLYVGIQFRLQVVTPDLESCDLAITVHARVWLGLQVVTSDFESCDLLCVRPWCVPYVVLAGEDTFLPYNLDEDTPISHQRNYKNIIHCI